MRTYTLPVMTATQFLAVDLPSHIAEADDIDTEMADATRKADEIASQMNFERSHDGTYPVAIWHHVFR